MKTTREAGGLPEGGVGQHVGVVLQADEVAGVDQAAVPQALPSRIDHRIEVDEQQQEQRRRGEGEQRQRTRARSPGLARRQWWPGAADRDARSRSSQALSGGRSRHLAHLIGCGRDSVAAIAVRRSGVGFVRIGWGSTS